MVTLNVPYINNNHKKLQQLAIVCEALDDKKRPEVKVLQYMVKHHSGGIYVIRRGYRDDIAKWTKLSRSSVKKIIGKLSSKKIIKYVTNGLGNNMGAYSFHPAVQLICNQTDILTIKFNQK
jgi:hypothetical protein